MPCVSVEGGMQLQECGESTNHRDAGPKGKGKNMVMWAETAFPHANLFLDSAWKAMREPLQCVRGLCACHAGCAVIVIVITASHRIICASWQPRFHKAHPLH